MKTMDPQRYGRIKTIFQRVCEHPADERSALIDSCCGDDDDLREQVERLLAHQDTPAFDFDEVASEIGGLLSDAAAAVNQPGAIPAQIGPYWIIRQIGEGGMGAVYLAQQQHPKRLLAVKVIKPMLASSDMLRRFEHEIQTLGRLQHPGIARIYDAGTASDGCPYLAMEFVDGAPITDYCDERRLSIDERLDLFITVGEAVQHAHMRGVIHRDLKPGNILVAEHDETPSEVVTRNGDVKRRSWPRIIDFGVAKVLHEFASSDQTMMTNPGILVGTLAYMSPEQARSDATDIDVRSDVYSLGVVLYQLLAGCLPVDPSRLRGVSSAERERLLWESPLPKPSSRISRLTAADDDAAGEIARARRLEPTPLSRKMKGELDWIVMKALSPERDRRYDSVASLIEDVRRYRRDEPVLARPPSAAYHMGKFARRHRALVAGATGVLSALVLGIAGTTWALIHAVAEADRAERESHRALAAEADAELRLTELEQVVDFQTMQLSSLDAALMGSRIRSGIVDARRVALQNAALDDEGVEHAIHAFERMLADVNFTTTALAVIDESMFNWAIQEIEKRFADQPRIQARLFQTISNTMRWNGLIDRATLPQVRALEIRRRTLGDDHPDTLSSINEMGRLLDLQGHLEEAEPLLREALEGRRRALGDLHETTLFTLNLVGALLRKRGRLDEAEPYYREALDGLRRTLPDDHPGTLFSIANLGSLLRDRGQFDEAEPLIRESLAGKRRKYGDDHIETLLSTIDMAILLNVQENYAEAESMLLDTLSRCRRRFGEDHFITLATHHFLGCVLDDQGVLDEAEAYYRQALEGRRRIFGDDHPDTQVTALRLATLQKNRADRADTANVP